MNATAIHAPDPTNVALMCLLDELDSAGRRALILHPTENGARLYSERLGYTVSVIQRLPQGLPEVDTVVVLDIHKVTRADAQVLAGIQRNVVLVGDTSHLPPIGERIEFPVLKN